MVGMTGLRPTICHCPRRRGIQYHRSIVSGHDATSISIPHHARMPDRTPGRRGGVMRKGWLSLTMIAALALAIHAITVPESLAQQWPTHPVRFVLPFGPGSAADTAAR